MKGAVGPQTAAPFYTPKTRGMDNARHSQQETR
jgi:hypothetical protein